MIESPIVNSIAWGEMEVQGLGTDKDWKLFPGGGRLWDWSETGTQHVPGIQVTDVEELIKQGAEIIVLSRGMHLRLQTCQETIDFLKQNGFKYYIEETKDAVRIYNEHARNGEPVGGLFHSTC